MPQAARRNAIAVSFRDRRILTTIDPIWLARKQAPDAGVHPFARSPTLPNKRQFRLARHWQSLQCGCFPPSQLMSYRGAGRQADIYKISGTRTVFRSIENRVS